MMATFAPDLARVSEIANPIPKYIRESWRIRERETGELTSVTASNDDGLTGKVDWKC